MNPCQVLFYKDEFSYSRNRAIGMSYLNRFLIEEEIQFECYGIYDEEFSYNRLVPFLNMLKKVSSDQPDCITGHVIIADISKYIPWNRYTAVSEHSIPDSGLIISRIESERLECVQKEKCKNFYTGGVVSYDSGYNFQQAYKSVGDDMDVFFRLITSGKMIANYQRSLRNYASDRFHECTVATFHLSMLSDDEETKMLSKNAYSITGDRRYPGFKFKTSVSRNERNYALSVCHRRTLIRHRGILYHNVHDTNIHFTFFKKKSFV